MEKQFFDRLDEFIRKYYKNILLKGILLSLFGLAVLFLLLNGLENWFYLSSKARLILLIVFITATLGALIWGVIRPIFKIFGLGSTMDYKSTEKLIKTHIPEIKDQLRNLLELNEKKQNGGKDEYLILEAAVKQKIDNLKFYNFVSAIRFRSNVKFLRLALIPLVLILAWLIFNPQSIKSSTHRILNYQEHFEKPSPFAFEITNERLETLQFSDYDLLVKSTGAEIPNDLWIQVGEYTYKMQKVDKLHFKYTFKNVNKTTSFALKIADFTTKDYVLTVLPRPQIFDFRVVLTYPSYTGLKSETVENNGDFRVPQGTNLRFQIRTKDVDSLVFVMNRKILNPSSTDGHTHIFNWRAMKDVDYALIPKNNNSKTFDSIFYSIAVVEDQYPGILVQEFRDTSTPSMVYFKGSIVDDYGFSALRIVISKTNETEDTLAEELSFSTHQVQQDFVYAFNTSEYMDEFGDRIDYYFEVYDNDAINGPKSSRTQQFTFTTKSEKELLSELDEQNENLIKSLEDNLKAIKKNQKDLDKLMRNLIDKPAPTWEERKAFEEILKAHEQLKLETDHLKQEMQSMFQNEQKLNPDNERLLEKQKLMEELFDQIMTEEMKKTLEELQALMQQQLPKDQLEKAIDQIKMNNADLEKQLDQNIEIFKQMDIERRLDESLYQLEQTIEKQKSLREDMAQSSEISQEQKAKQEDINKSFEDIQKSLDEALQLNEALEDPLKFERNESKEKEAKDALDQALNQMQSGNKSNAQDKQAEAQSKMEELSEEMNAMMDAAEEESNAEDAAMIRRLLKYIVKTSLNQEEAMATLKSIRINDPKYQAMIRRQHELKSDVDMISDSLYALGKRQPSVAVLINKELQSMNAHSKSALDDLLGMNDVINQRYSRTNNNAVNRQQYLMTSLNNMSLLLAESLKNMDDAQKKGNGKRGSKSCPNPSAGSGQKKGKAQSARELQEQLNKQLEQMRRQQKSGGQMPQQAQGQKSMSEQFARSAAQQEAVRRLLQEAANELKQQGGKATGELQGIIDEMEKIERDLVNKILDDNTLRRQNQILTRLLEAEQAELRREQEERRQSKEAKQNAYTIPKEILEFQKKQAEEMEMLQKYQPILKPYYQQKTQEYFKQR